MFQLLLVSQSTEQIKMKLIGGSPVFGKAKHKTRPLWVSRESAEITTSLRCFSAAQKEFLYHNSIRMTDFFDLSFIF